MSKKDHIYYMTDYYYGNRFEDDATAMASAVRTENFFSLIRDNKKEDLEKELKNNPRALYYTNNLRQTALHIACKNNRPEILALLLSKIPPQTKIIQEDRFINKRDSEGFSALMVCADDNRVECAKLLMAHQPDLKIVGYDLKRNVAHLAAQKNADEILRMVLTATDKNGKNILNIDEPCKEKVIRGFTPAHFAASNFAHKSIQVLKELGADLNASAQNKTPMMVALQNGSRSVVSYLLEQPEVDLTIKDKQGLTAYDYAIHFRTPIEEIQKIKEKLLEQKKSQTKKVSHKARTISIDSEHTKA